MLFEFLQLFHIIAQRFRIVEFFYRVCCWDEDILRLPAPDRKRVCGFCVEKPLPEKAFSGIVYEGQTALREAMIRMNTQKRLNYEEPVPAGVTAGSVLLILSCLGLVTLPAVIGDRISDTKRRDNQ